MSKRYIHEPVLEKKCTPCHVDDLSRAGSEGNSAAQKKQKSPIRWLAIEQTPLRDHTFLLDPDETGDTLLVEVTSPPNPPLRREITIPQPQLLEQLANDGTAPRISAVSFAALQEIMFTVVIKWQTDEPANASVRYGAAALDQTAAEEHIYVKHHEIILSGLKRDASYRATITSTDIFGNSNSTGVIDFSTSGLPLAAHDAPPGEQGEESKLSFNFSRLTEKKLLMEAHTPFLATVSLGTRQAKTIRRPFADKNATGSAAETKTGHAKMQPKEFSSMKVCPTCHPSYNDIKSHPVNILPPHGMTIPPEYPTLENGRISCISCHTNHAADTEFRLITSSREDLCLGCHEDKF